MHPPHLQLMLQLHELNRPNQRNVSEHTNGPDVGGSDEEECDVSTTSSTNAPVTRTKPTKPTKPTHPTRPTKPTEPTTVDDFVSCEDVSEHTNGPDVGGSDEEECDASTTSSTNAPVTRTKPTKPTKPTHPTRPTKPTHPTKPTKPTEPTKPTTVDDFVSCEDVSEYTNGPDVGGSDEEDCDASTTSSTNAPVTRTKPTKPTRPTHPTRPTKPTHSTKPTKPTEPTTVDDFVSCEDVSEHTNGPDVGGSDEEECDASTTSSTNAPVTRTKPTKPTKPTHPTRSTKPTEPTKPTTVDDFISCEDVSEQTNAPVIGGSDEEECDASTTSSTNAPVTRTNPTKPTKPTHPTRTTKPTEPTKPTSVDDFVSCEDVSEHTNGPDVGGSDEEECDAFTTSSTNAPVTRTKPTRPTKGTHPTTPTKPTEPTKPTTVDDFVSCEDVSEQTNAPVIGGSDEEECDASTTSSTNAPVTRTKPTRPTKPTTPTSLPTTTEVGTESTTPEEFVSCEEVSEHTNLPDSTSTTATPGAGESCEVSQESKSAECDPYHIIVHDSKEKHTHSHKHFDDSGAVEHSNEEDCKDCDPYHVLIYETSKEDIKDPQGIIDRATSRRDKQDRKEKDGKEKRDCRGRPVLCQGCKDLIRDGQKKPHERFSALCHSCQKRILAHHLASAEVNYSGDRRSDEEVHTSQKNRKATKCSREEFKESDWYARKSPIWELPEDDDCDGTTGPTTKPTSRPTKATRPTRPTKPTRSTTPSIPTKPTRPTRPTIPTDPTKRTRPTRPTKPSTTTKSDCSSEVQPDHGYVSSEECPESKNQHEKQQSSEIMKETKVDAVEMDSSEEVEKIIRGARNRQGSCSSCSSCAGKRFNFDVDDMNVYKTGTSPSVSPHSVYCCCPQCVSQHEQYHASLAPVPLPTYNSYGYKCGCSSCVRLPVDLPPARSPHSTITHISDHAHVETPLPYSRRVIYINDREENIPSIPSIAASMQPVADNTYGTESCGCPHGEGYPNGRKCPYCAPYRGEMTY
ncbi:mucin-2-like [Atheta coriaria]|uniref:mucin-2-like n=1 Tax=Dalotia coriaria TaxID=877792 RepID=UPI0031F36E19